jgi:hypothetical protein
MSTRKSGNSGNQRGRDAGTGQFIPIREALRRPATTVVETLPKPRKK